MEEKKLTDEQESLLIEFDEYGFAPTITMPNAEEYAKAWRNSLIDMFQRLNFLQAEQKAKIEGQRKIIEYQNSVEDRNAELQKQIEAWKAKSRELDEAWEIASSNEEKLQKQVDELKGRYLEESKERCKFEHLYNKKCHEHNIGLGVQRKHWENKVQQAVKDTTKEIEKELEDKGYFEYGQFTINGNDFIEIFKKRGVEVE